VLHHNPYQPEIFEHPDFPLRVPSCFGWAHSPQFSPDLAARYAATPAGWPFQLHACEGTDDQARAEIHQLESAGVLGGRTVLVHGVALDCDGVVLVRRRGASLVWCPSANEHTLGRTISRETLDSGIPIALGTDSAITAAGDLIDELAVARRYTDSARLYDMVTAEPARILRLDAGEGEIRPGGVADLVAVRDQGQTPAEALSDLRPELVMLAGRVRLISEEIAGRIPISSGFQPVAIEGRGRWLTDIDLQRIMAPVESVLGRDFRLAGRKVAA